MLTDELINRNEVWIIECKEKIKEYKVFIEHEENTIESLRQQNKELKERE